MEYYSNVQNIKNRIEIAEMRCIRYSLHIGTNLIRLANHFLLLLLVIVCVFFCDKEVSESIVRHISHECIAFHFNALESRNKNAVGLHVDGNAMHIFLTYSDVFVISHVLSH